MILNMMARNVQNTKGTIIRLRVLRNATMILPTMHILVSMGREGAV